MTAIYSSMIKQFWYFLTRWLGGEVSTEDSHEDEQKKHQRRHEIKSQCLSGNGIWIHQNPHGPQVILLSGVVVKFGFGVTEQEAETQAYYHRHADRASLVIPEVFDFFLDPADEVNHECGFLVMEYIQGCVVRDLPSNERVEVAPRVAKAMRYLETIEPPFPSRPGPLIDGGIPLGYFWPHSGADRAFESVEDLNAWLDQQLRLSHREASIELHVSELGSRHMDITPRNILRTVDDKICFVDWQFSGNYPKEFELLHLRNCQPDDPEFFDILLEALPNLEQGLDMTRYVNLAYVMRNNMLYGARPVGRVPLPYNP